MILIYISFSVIAILLILLYFNLYKQNKQLKQEISRLNIASLNIKDEVELHFKEKFDSWCVVKEKQIRKDAMDRSRNIMRGQATEHLAPIMMEDYSIKDFRFLGNPVDYIVFNGASDVTDKTKDEIESIVFVDIKTGKSRLNKVQRRIRDCIKEGRVEFIVYNPDKEQ